MTSFGNRLNTKEINNSKAAIACSRRSDSKQRQSDAKESIYYRAALLSERLEQANGAMENPSTNVKTNV